MIVKKVVTSILFSLLCIQSVSAQGWSDRASNQYDNDWSIGVGFNQINNSGNGIEYLFNISDWNFGIPFYISAENYRNNKFSIGATLSFNYIREGNKIDGQTILEGGNEASYAAFDLAVKHYFRDALKLKYFKSYVSLGLGVTHIGDYQTEENNQMIRPKKRKTFNIGLGYNYWFSSTWGINLNVVGKYSIESTATNQLQSSLGVLYHVRTNKIQENE